MNSLTTEEHHTLAQASQLEGNICAILALLFAAAGIAGLAAFRWDGLVLLPVAGILLAAANRAFTSADLHHSAAHQDTP